MVTIKIKTFFSTTLILKHFGIRLATLFFSINKQVIEDAYHYTSAGISTPDFIAL